MPAVLMPMEEFAMKKLDGTLVNVLLVTREQTVANAMLTIICFLRH